MITFLKANIASIIASLFDYVVTIIAVSFFKTPAVFGGIIGTLCGGVMNFLIGRQWVFVGGADDGYNQGARYFLVWTGNLALNAAGMYLFTKAGTNFMIAKVATSLLVAVAYNFPLQKYYVFNMRGK